MAQKKNKLTENILPLTDELFTSKEPWGINSLSVSAMLMIKQGQAIQNIKLSYVANVLKKNIHLYKYLSWYPQKMYHLYIKISWSHWK